MRLYHDYAQKLIRWLGDVTLQHVRRTDNKKADAFSTLASMLTLPDQTKVTVCQKWIVPPSNEEEYIENKLDHIVAIVEAAKEDWRQPIIDYLCYGILSENPRRRTDIRRRAPRFLYYKDTLYRRSFEGMLLRCLGRGRSDSSSARSTLRSMWITSIWTKTSFSHKDYWPTMVKDCLYYARKCYACQFYANFIHQPPEVVHPTIASWQIDAWGLDIVGP